MNIPVNTVLCVVVALLIILMIFSLSCGVKHEKFVSGESIYMEPEYNYYFSKCLQSYPIAFRGPINDGWYTCSRKTEELLKDLGSSCDYCYNH